MTYRDPENPDEPGTLEPKDDVAQTPVQKPEIGTTLADEKGNKSVAAGKKTVLVDTIAYKGLDPSKWYVFAGTLMVKDTKEPYAENGKKLEVTSEPFKPEKSEGTAAVTFVIDTTDLAGKELVAFETVYRLNDYKEGDDLTKAGKTVVAEHKDIEDSGQTVKVIKVTRNTPEKTTETPKTLGAPGTSTGTPKTGDDRNPWIWLGMIAGGLAVLSGSVLLFLRHGD